MKEIIGMTRQELDRYRVLGQVEEKRLKQREAADLLGISARQVRNLLVRYKAEGAAGLISRHRGKQGNNHKSQEFKHQVMEIVRKRYGSYGPTFVQEKLEEWHQLKVSDETLRQWMIQAKLWESRSVRSKQHLPRLRRACFGELIQADGSHHRWFGDEHPLCCATVLIDDATSMITALVFSESETLQAYFTALEQHVKTYGNPRALYTDHSAIAEARRGVGGTTQLQRALQELGIELILANSPQAKGRVERANQTLQDRLVKEFELRGIKTIEEANIYAKEFVVEYNRKFSKKPMNSFDAHRPLEGIDLHKILSRCEERTLLSDCTFQCDNKFYKVQGISAARRSKGGKVKLYTSFNGKMRVFFGEQELQVQPLCEIEAPPTMTRKEVLVWEPKKHYTPSRFHPWKRDMVRGLLVQKRPQTTGVV